MAERLRQAGHQIVGYDVNPVGRDVDSLAALVAALAAPRVVWVMLPAGPITDDTVAQLTELLQPGDVLVNGGNDRYTRDIEHGEDLSAKGLGYIDAGVSGGIWGLTEGYALMVGGAPEHVALVQPIFDALAPPGGFVHAGPIGAGHYAKMVHNGIEYGLMQAYAEGYELLGASELGIDVPKVLDSWRVGSVVRSWLLDLLVKALQEHPGLADIAGYADDTGEGRWTVEESIRLAVPMPVIASALYARFGSRQADSPSMQAVAALRQQFGGHAIKTMDSKPATP
ncbi:MAG: 6-phosphogluconate dehydrogenase (decarboxylating) [Acidimicrobiia bacterium]|nr:6-phosphogluconate dehydrogenase (decarboxylating) [Acidimicrobiia bacterium]